MQSFYAFMEEQALSLLLDVVTELSPPDQLDAKLEGLK